MIGYSLLSLPGHFPVLTRAHGETAKAGGSLPGQKL